MNSRIGLVAAVALTLSACAPSLFQSARSGSSDQSSMCGETCFDKPNSPYTLMTANQMWAGMLNVTGLNNAATSSMRQEFDARASTLPETDNIAGVSAPLQMAATSVAGEVCNQLVAVESAAPAAGRKHFAQVNFSAALSANTVAAFNSATDSMARAFWGRGANEDERRLLNEYYTDFVASGGTQATATRKLYMTACAAMLSSFDAITN